MDPDIGWAISCCTLPFAEIEKAHTRRDQNGSKKTMKTDKTNLVPSHSVSLFYPACFRICEIRFCIYGNEIGVFARFRFHSG
jgi:hypothetical protein